MSGNVSFTLPSADGTSGQALVTNASGVLSFADKANITLNNLGTTAVNADLVPSTNDTKKLGSAAAPWNTAYFRTGGVNYLTDTGTNAVQTVAPSGMSGSYTLTWPSNASGNVGYLLTDASGTGTLGWSAPGISSATMYTELDAQETNRPADIACVSNITLSGSQTCDGQSSFGAFSALVMGQTDPTEDGWYFTNAFGAWTRLTGSSGIASIPGQLFCVTASGGGTNYSDTCWIGGGDGSSTATFTLLPRAGTATHTNLTASKALVTNASGQLTTATTTATEIGYVSGVTSAIQTQIGTKTTNPMTTTGDIIYASNTATPATAARLAVGGANTVLHGGASVPAYAAVADADLTGQIGVAHGGTGIASGTSGGIPYFSGTTTIASSALLTNHAVVIGTGDPSAPKTISAGTDGQLLVGVTSGDPAFGSTVSAATTFSGGILLATSGGSASNFNSYEEGTFTPTVVCSTSGAVTYTTQVADFTRMGNRIFYNLYLNFAKNTCLGNLTLGGLPYTSLNTSNHYYAAAAGYTHNLIVPVGLTTYGFAGIVTPNATVITPYFFDSAQDSTQATATNLSSSSNEMVISGNYIKN